MRHSRWPRVAAPLFAGLLAVFVLLAGEGEAGAASCGNHNCQASIGETCTTCPADCGSCPAICGSNGCESTETCSTCPADCGACPVTCPNGTCSGTETCSTCPSDCGVCVVCGNSSCQTGETCSSCPFDCGACPAVCGDASCNGSETCSSCPGDCGACPASCGNGNCNGSETCSNCPTDCGVCPPVCGDLTCEGGESCGNCTVDCGECAPVCGDTTCASGENCSSCPADCGACPAVCGNIACEVGESCASCPGDCNCASCGDGSCIAPDEDCVTCEADCGACPCGDGTCQSTENCSSCAADCGTCTTCGDGACDASENCSTCSDDCGTCVTSSFGECPPDLPACTDEANDCCYRGFDAGSIIIPMDRCHQSISGGQKFDPPTVNDAFCSDSAGGGDDGMFRAYGLAYRLMQQGIPVYWMINPTKDPLALTISEKLSDQTYTVRDIDFWVLSSGATAPASGGSLSACGAGCTPPVLHLDATTLAPIAGSYTKQQFPTRGAAFVIAAEDRADFDAFWAKGGGFARFAGDPLYDFSQVELYEMQAGSTAVYLDYRGAGPVYSEFNGGDSAPVIITLDYQPPRLARQSPAAVSTSWLGKANLNDPAAYPACLTADFSPTTAVFCDVTADEMEAGYLSSGDFTWAWLDNLNGSSCDAALMDELNEYMTAVPGVKDGHSVYFMESSVSNAEACDGKEPLGAFGGLDTENNPANEPFIIRYPQNVFIQVGDIPLNFAQGSVTKWNYSSVGYQGLESLRRLVTEDTGTLCSYHRSTADCDAYAGTTGDMADVAGYARLDDVEANGIVFYMGGRNIAQNGNAAHLRMILDSFLATPAGQVDSTPESQVVVEVSRSAPVVATVALVESQYQGTISVIDPPAPVTTFNGAQDALAFQFPHFTGHFRAIEVANISSTASDFDDLVALFDANNEIPDADIAGCGGPPYTATCRNVFTSLVTGALPNPVAITSSNATVLQPFVGPALTVPETETLLELVLAGRKEGGVRVPRIGGIDRSTAAVIEQSPVTGEVRPTMVYVGALDGMLHAICAEVLGACQAAGQELWAYIPRTQLPLLSQNLQRIDGSPKVAEVFGDFDPDDAVGARFHTVLTFQTGAGAPGYPEQAPAIIAIEVSDPASPRILWELSTPAARGAFDVGVGLNLAMGPVRVGSTIRNLTFAQTTNGGTGGAGFLVDAIDTLTGELVWSYQHAFDPARDAANPPPPATGLPAGVAAYSENQGTLLTHVIAPSLYGDLWLIDAGTGANVHGNKPLFRFTTDFHPFGSSPTVFLNPLDGKLTTLAVSGGYADPVSANWAPDGVEQFAVAMALDSTSVPLDETTATAISLGTNRAYAQAVVGGNEIFIVTDTADVNSASYGLSGGGSGQLLRYSLVTGALVGGATSLPGGASSVDVTSNGIVYSGAGKSAQKEDVSATFAAGGGSTELAVRDNVLRLLWLSE